MKQEIWFGRGGESPRLVWSYYDTTRTKKAACFSSPAHCDLTS
jgi:hypothetical protein